jgi:lipopolysaccharide/colanic/teichoic acid biosynthesis glycosyltransferase
VLFRQRRLGYRGQSFYIYKFRTMRSDAEQCLVDLEARNESARGLLFKLRDDPRVTRLGHFLRRTNLDELPQLWNVLRGEMSLVGPRPFQMRDSDRILAVDPSAFQKRLEFRPGLTGAWQVGRLSPTDSEHLLELDLDYVQNWSLRRDLGIMYRTFFILIAGLRARD